MVYIAIYSVWLGFGGGKIFRGGGTPKNYLIHTPHGSPTPYSLSKYINRITYRMVGGEDRIIQWNEVERTTSVGLNIV